MDISNIVQNKILFYNADNGDSGPMDDHLIRAGYKPLHANNEAKVLKLARTEQPVAILIYLDSCGSSGLQTCKKLRTDERSSNAILFMISSHDGEVEIVQAFQNGADDFLPRLHGPRELLARLTAMQRRTNGKESHIIKIRDLEIDLNEQKVRQSGRLVQLTYIQFKLLCLLISHRYKIFSRGEIQKKIWGNSRTISYRTIDVHIKRLRENLGEVKYPSQYIETIHGVGYQFVK